MSKPKLLAIFDSNTSGTAHSKFNNIISNVTKSGNSLILPSDIHVSSTTLFTFKAPCSCSDVDSVRIGGNIYALVDATNDSIPSTDSFYADAIISVLLDPVTKKAYLQNSASSRYVAYNEEDAPKLVVSESSESLEDTDKEIANGSVHVNSIVNGEVQSTHRILGSGATQVVSDSAGNIVVKSSTGITYGTADLVEGVSELAEGTLYFVVPE